MKISFRIDGVPVPKGRPRFAKMGKFVKAYTPKETQNWEEFIKWQSLEHKPPKPQEGPCELDLVFYMPRPKSLPKKVKICAKKPDIENLAKSVLDALEGIFYKNDSQVFRLSLEKVYSEETPGVDVMLNFPMDNRNG